ncbi:MAG: hypothetical protein KDD76_06110, partial [Rickettsiales bacterium]|nr:hypothetical protein [Rickettsiales bacterium]
MAPRKQGDKGRTGLEKAAVVMMSLDVDIAAKIFGMMNEQEIKEISQTMTSLGSIKPEMVDGLLKEFVNELSQGQGIVGSLESTEKLLSQVLGKEKVATIMEDISGPAGRNTWDKLNNVSEEVLAAFLKNEYPQTVALVLSKIRTSQAARVLSILPEEFALEILQRMITLEPVKREVLSGIEKTLQSEFMSSLATTKKFNSFES